MDSFLQWDLLNEHLSEQGAWWMALQLRMGETRLPQLSRADPNSPWCHPNHLGRTGVTA